MDQKQELNKKLTAAIWIATLGASAVGIKTKNQLMHPYASFTDEDVTRTAARLLASVHTAWLKDAPLPLIEPILKDQSAYLSFALGDGWPDESSPSQEVEARHQAGPSSQFDSASGRCHPDRPSSAVDSGA
ncbi:hypothetical protein KSF73_10415 [Burkholderiaceae bacterium DAT-1]|nr:hypothetical protein [Burkholderiaceae bacterium DAT-1]